MPIVNGLPVSPSYAKYLVTRMGNLQFDLPASAARYPLSMKGYLLKEKSGDSIAHYTFGTGTIDNIRTFVNCYGVDDNKIEKLLLLAGERYDLFLNELKRSNALSGDEKSALFFTLVLKRISFFSALNFCDELLRLQNYMKEVSNLGHSPQLTGLTLTYDFPVQIGGGLEGDRGQSVNFYKIDKGETLNLKYFVRLLTKLKEKRKAKMIEW